MLTLQHTDGLLNVYGPGIAALKRKNGAPIPKHRTSSLPSILGSIAIVGGLASQVWI